MKMRRLIGHGALERLALGGGTSLALRFGHRQSVDLECFTTAEFEPRELGDTPHDPGRDLSM